MSEKPEHFTHRERLPIDRLDRLKHTRKRVKLDAGGDSGKVLKEKQGDVRREVDSWLEWRGK